MKKFFLIFVAFLLIFPTALALRCEKCLPKPCSEYWNCFRDVGYCRVGYCCRGECVLKCTGKCLPHPCDYYYDCEKAEGKCLLGHCCRGECKEPEELPPAERIEEIKRKANLIYEKVKFQDLKMEILTTTYKAGEIGTVWLQLLKDFQPVDDAFCELTVWYPNKTKWLDKVPMVHLEDGIYYFDLLIPNELGVYMLVIECFRPMNLTITPPLHDTWVWSCAPDTNYGNMSVLVVGTLGGCTGETYLKFNVSSIPDKFDKALLFLYKYYGRSYPVGTYKIEEDWDENLTTWNTRPSRGDTSYDTIYPSMGWNAWDITQLVREWETNNYGVALNGTVSGGGIELQYFYSKEGTYAPFLLVFYNESEWQQYIRGGGEIHVTEFANESRIGMATWKTFLKLGTPPLMKLSEYYCKDNTTLVKNHTFTFCEGTKCETYSIFEEIKCDWGCDPVTNSCAPNPFYKWLMVVGIIAGIFLVVIFIWRRWGGYYYR